MESKATIKGVAEATNHFGMNLYKILAKENTNVFFSPFSLSTAVAMLFCGAQNETAEEMREVLGCEAANIKDEELKFCFQKPLDALGGKRAYYTLECANALVIHKEFPAKDEYKSLLKDNFKALLREADFVNETVEAVELVNEWVKMKTSSMIPKSLDSLDPEAVLIILNAVYFKGLWLDPFKQQYTYLQDFYNKGGKNNCPREVDMMHITETFPYTKQESYKALELPYKGRDISMLILLPDSEDGLSELENSLSSTFIKDVKQSMSSTEVRVALPRFQLEYSKSLKEAFQSLGLNRVFRSGAHLNGINDSDELFLSGVNHKAVLVVNEAGTEATAVTYEVLTGCSTTMEYEKFIVDHPFMFAIYTARENLILFMGRVVEL
ncbi:putative serpin-like protein TK1782 [Araneus ventricosus]|uniref:Putative serpin-like protein TK1782 n=1 Tax=Araneus ventricosus TaxID=182803 RepID=A0A4Y2LZ49_ARAVE|nr:putative serpin-like protein TK1782 [Araneus ventricosus]